MVLCRLCLNKIKGVGISNQDIFNDLEIFLPEMTLSFVENPAICEDCLDNINTAYTFFRYKIETDIKIQEHIERYKISKIDLKELCESADLTVISDVCRICLKLINNNYRIYLQESTDDTRQEVMEAIFEVCNISLDFAISDNPVMCSNCWKLLQKMFRFKTNFINAEKKIKRYYKSTNKTKPIPRSHLEKVLIRQHKSKTVPCNEKKTENKLNVDLLVNGCSEPDLSFFHDESFCELEDMFDDDGE